ncbi:GNAT family N-acetyltransferase [Arsenicicoccus dermatophilus]|uniref:GNAT family N-acetyltransferase n=1 Tax=Arsenicicoccus dermatophilus TaxID=1076331 RepID=UPI00391761A1
MSATDATALPSLLHPPLELRTERLLLRPWRPEDRAPFATLNADPEVMAYFPTLLSQEESDDLANRFDKHVRARGWGMWAVEVVGGEPFVGFVGLDRPRFAAPFMPCIEIGWRLARSAWGQGYATEAATEVLRVAFEVLGLEEVVALTSSINLRSRAVMQRLGMTHDLADDFEHPLVAADDVLRHHVLYRARRGVTTTAGSDLGTPAAEGRA